ncbi:unnamed protein product [Caenorhabditis brenneri]
MVFNVFKRGKRIFNKVFTSSRKKHEPVNIPVRKSQDELEWDKCQKFIMETPLATVPEELSFETTQQRPEVIEKTFQKEIGNCKSLKEFKKRISKEHDASMSQITIAYKGRILTDRDVGNKTFAHYCMDARSIIDVTICPV